MSILKKFPEKVFCMSVLILAGSTLMAFDDPEQLDADAVPPGSVRPSITMAEQVLACETDSVQPDQALAYLHINGLRDTEGNIRVQVYSDKEEDFLEKGAWLARIDVPVEDEDDARVCVSLPSVGSYALVIMHDRDADGRADILTEGFGFSRNPSLGFSPPDHDEVVTRFSEGISEMSIDMTYMLGGNNKERRRRRR